MSASLAHRAGRLLTGGIAMGTGTDTVRPSAISTSTRRYELDWLRALIILRLIPFHAVGIFTAVTASYLETSAASPTVHALVELINIWGTPLLFLVAGASAWFALGSRTGSAYLRERVTRLLIPFAFATLGIIPFQV